VIPAGFDRPQKGISQIHYGRIGSGNTLLRDAALRDELAQQHQLRAFEMEGSGIADATWEGGCGYLLIRGISELCRRREKR
jgi:nucleoside phosphorylase